MAKSKYWESLFVDYVCNTIKDKNLIPDFETYLQNHPDVQNEIAALKNTLATTDPIGKIDLPDKILDDLEIKVYKRLASAKPTEKPLSFSHKVGIIPTKTLWMQGSLLTIMLLAIGLALKPFVISPILSNTPISEVETKYSSIPLPNQQKRM